MNTTIQLNELTSKEKLAVIQREFTNDILDGNINPLQAAAILKSMEDFSKTVRGNVLVKDCIREELDKYTEKSVHFNGLIFTKKVVGTRYDYSNCNDPIYNRRKLQYDIAAANLKEREEFLKIVPLEGLTVVDDETGEVYQIIRADTKSEDGYAISYSK